MTVGKWSWFHFYILDTNLFQQITSHRVEMKLQVSDSFRLDWKPLRWLAPIQLTLLATECLDWEIIPHIFLKPTWTRLWYAMGVNSYWTMKCLPECNGAHFVSHCNELTNLLIAHRHLNDKDIKLLAIQPEWQALTDWTSHCRGLIHSDFHCVVLSHRQKVLFTQRPMMAIERGCNKH